MRELKPDYGIDGKPKALAIVVVIDVSSDVLLFVILDNLFWISACLLFPGDIVLASRNCKVLMLREIRRVAASWCTAPDD